MYGDKEKVCTQTSLLGMYIYIGMVYNETTAKNENV
jgi:hypothetical protein